MTSRAPETYLELAEAGWRWVLDQVVRDDDGPSVPETVADDGTAPANLGLPTAMYSGVGGLAHVLTEIRLSRAWTPEEDELAAGIAERVRRGVPAASNADYFDGLVSDIGVLTALRTDGADAAVARLWEIAEQDGWPQDVLGGERYVHGARVSDVTLGTASVLLGATWAHRQGVTGSLPLAGRAATILLAEAEERASGLSWRFVPARFGTAPPVDMPNWSHGLAGIAASLALAGVELDRPDLVDAARLGAEHLVTLGHVSDGGFTVPVQVPRPPSSDANDIAFGWCHGASGTSRLFAALALAGVAQVVGDSPAVWERRCLHSVRTSGLPARLRPGFWDNDGRCCGTAGVGDVFLDAWQRGGDPDDLAFALTLADALVERAYRDGDRAWWRFVEHRKPDPLLPPGVGWMQGVAGIASYLFRAARLARDGRQAPAAVRMDNWWTLPVA